jgi:hypothetical protein
MSNSKIPKAIFSWLIIFSIILFVSGCARWPDGPGPGPDETKYQLEITVEVKGEINTDEGIYYIVLDADSESIDGPVADINFWDADYYYIKLENDFFYFAQKEEGSPEIQLVDSLYSGNKLQVTIALSDLGNPNSLDINVLTTDSDNNIYDSLDNSYFTINTNLGSKPPINDQEGDSGDGGVDFDIVKVTAQITIP